MDEREVTVNLDIQVMECKKCDHHFSVLYCSDHIGPFVPANVKDPHCPFCGSKAMDVTH